MLITAQDQVTAVLNNVNAALGRLEGTSRTTGSSFGQMTGAFTLGSVAANAITGALSAAGNAMAGAAGATLNLASRLEQARIGFTTMLGSVQKADQFIGQLQQKAESTAFNFPGIQQVAQSFLAMGVAAGNVIPLIDDISNALSAAGHGGDTAMLQRVGQSLSEIAAAGKLSGEQIRELSRDGIAVLPLLAEAFGKTAGEVRKMAENGEISADMFFKAFHSEVALHYGDIQAQQAKTWAVAASNVQDIIGRLATQTFKELTDAATAAALALNDFLHSERFLQWAANVKASIHEVLLALAPLGAALQAALGGGGGPQPLGPSATPLGPSPDEVAKAMTVPPAAIKSAEDYAAKIAAGEANVHRLTASLTGLSAQQNDLKNQISDIQAGYAAQLAGLRTQQEGLNASIETTKEHWAGVIEPLKQTQAQLKRLEEDTKSAFAAILDPLKSQLDGVNQKIGDTKAAFEAATRPIQAQIDAIDRANSALAKQRDLVVAIADLALRQKSLAALGDPNLRADIAGKLKLLDLNRADLDRQKELLDLGNKKGNSDKAIAAVQQQLDENTRQRIGLEQTLANAADKNALAQVASQAVLNDAQKEALAIKQKQADLDAAAAKAPLEDQLAAAKAQLATLLSPLEAQAAALTRMIQSVSATEAAALKPIADAQALVARQIEDANAAMQAALKPLEAAAKGVAAQIASTEAAERAALAPLQERLRLLEQESADLELQKKQIADKIQGWKDEAAAAKATAEEAAKVSAALDLSGGVTPASAPAPLVGVSLIPPETIQSWKDLATNVEAAATAFDHLNISTSGGLVAGIEAAGKFLVAFAAVGFLTGKIQAFTAALNAAGLAALGAQVFWTAWAIFVVASIDTVKKEWDATDWSKVGDDLNATLENMKGAWAAAVQVFKDMGDNIKGSVTLMLKDSREGGSNPFPQMAAWFSGFPSQVTAARDAVVAVFTGMGTNIKAATDLMLKATSQGGSNPFPDLQASFDGFLASVKPTTDAIVKVFEPLALILKTIGDAIITMPKDLPGWLGGLLALIRGGGGGGGGNIQTTLRPGQSGGWSDIPPWMQGGVGEGGLSGNTLLKYVQDAFSAALGDEAGRVAAAIALTEGGLYGARGDNNQSAGVFQFYGGPGGGQLNAFAAFLNTSLADAADIATNQPDVAVQFALRGYLGKAIQAGLALGLSGPELATYAQRYGQVSVSPERAGQSYNSLFGPGGSAPQSTVDLSGGVSGQNRLLSYTPTPGWNPQMAQAQADAEQALADAQARLNQIMAGTPAINNAAAASTTANAVAQQQAATWAQTMDAQQAALNATLAQQVPPGRAAADAMEQLGAVLGPVERQIAAGTITADTLRGTLLDLAKATGLADQPWQDFATGAADANAAMEELINQTADLSPEFRAVADYLKTAGSSSNEAALRWLQAAEAYAAAKKALAAAPAVPPVPATTANSVDVVGANWTDVKAAQDNAAESLRQYQVVVQGLDPAKIKEQQAAWDSNTEAVGKLSDGLHNLADFLDRHEFHVKINVDEIPWWATPGSPTPFETGLWGIKRAGDALRGSPVRLMSGDQPTLSASARAVALGASNGSGQAQHDAGNITIAAGAIVVNGAGDPAATARAVRDELIRVARRNGGRGGIV